MENTGNKTNLLFTVKIEGEKVLLFSLVLLQ